MDGLNVNQVNYTIPRYRLIPHWVTAFIFAFFVAQPAYGALIADYSPYGLQGRMFGLNMLFSFGLGSLAGVMAGYVADRHGTEWVFRMMAVAGAFVFLSTVYLLVLSTRRLKSMQGIEAR